MSEESKQRQDGRERTDEERAGGADRRRFLKQAAVAGAAAYAAPKVASAQVEPEMSPVILFSIAPSDADPEMFCRYQVLTITDGADDCPLERFKFLCVDCPEEGDCTQHAFLGRRPFQLFADETKETLICKGTWAYSGKKVVEDGKLIRAFCQKCDGQKGYRFV